MNMSDFEFDVLDELYFIQSFEALQGNLGCTSDDLAVCLQTLLDKGWIKLAEPIEDQIVPPVTFNIIQSPIRYHYLISKEGLLAHNSA